MFFPLRCARVALMCLLLLAAGAEFASAARTGPTRTLLQRGAAQTLATLNAQSAVYAATVGGNVWDTQYATGYAQRSAIGAAYRATPYLSRQDDFDRTGGGIFWGGWGRK